MKSLKDVRIPKATNLGKSELTEYIPPIKYGRVIEVYDGESITVACKTHVLSKFYKFSIKLDGIGTPELRTSDKSEKKYATRVRNILFEKIFDKIVKLDVKGLDEYGRYRCDVFYDSININTWLLEHNFAVKYDGGKKNGFDPINYKL